MIQASEDDMGQVDMEAEFNSQVSLTRIFKLNLSNIGSYSNSRYDQDLWQL
jgi:hypothetical protein